MSPPCHLHVTSRPPACYPNPTQYLFLYSGHHLSQESQESQLSEERQLSGERQLSRGRQLSGESQLSPERQERLRALYVDAT